LNTPGGDARTFPPVLRTLLRVAFASALTAYILWKSHPSDVMAVVRTVDPLPIVCAVLLVLVDRALMAYRWVALLCTIEPHRRPPLGAVMRIFFVSTFVGTFLPAFIGTDAVRSYSTARLNVAGADAVASVLMDRILGIASLLLMALVGLVFARELLSNVPVLIGLAIAAIVSCATMALIFSRKAAALAGRLLQLMPAEAFRRLAARLLDSIRKYASHPQQLANVLAGSVAVQLLRILQAYFLGRSVGIDAALTVYVAFVPLILLIMLLPVTLSGIGTSQAAFVWFFARAGVDPAAAFALSALFVALGIVGNLPGALIYVFERRRH
jgi:uncharacterized protein (TIRG00374 family)